MTTTGVFLTDLLFTVCVCAGVLAYINKHLRNLLVELCGTAERAQFWRVFSNVTLVLVPLIFVLDYRPEIVPERAAIFEMAAQLKQALIGLMAAFGSLGVVLFSFVRRGAADVAGRPAR